MLLYNDRYADDVWTKATKTPEGRLVDPIT